MSWSIIGLIVALVVKYTGKPKPLSPTTVILIAAFGAFLTTAVGL